mmetsp:Transcript_38030/g.83378  ORF Transcript_38030/g.83378 Transcript_38030/m.83378 type:complete len:192 (+) Transcript_38030:534-1109(+)
MPMPINCWDAQETVLPRLEMEQYWTMYLDDCHPCAIATGHRRRCSNGSLVPMIHVHSRSVTYVVEDNRREPFECLTTLSLVGPLNDVEGMNDCGNVQDKDEMMNGVKYLILDLVSKEGCETNDQEESKDTVSRYHDFRSKFVAEILLPVGTKKSKEREEEEGSDGDDADHCVTKVYMQSHHSIEWNDSIKY